MCSISESTGSDWRLWSFKTVAPYSLFVTECYSLFNYTDQIRTETDLYISQLTTLMCLLSWTLGSSTSWNPQSLSRAVMDCFTFTYQTTDGVAVWLWNYMWHLPGSNPNQHLHGRRRSVQPNAVAIPDCTSTANSNFLCDEAVSLPVMTAPLITHKKQYSVFHTAAGWFQQSRWHIFVSYCDVTWRDVTFSTVSVKPVGKVNSVKWTVWIELCEVNCVKCTVWSELCEVNCVK